MKLVLFDIDGTLVNSQHEIVSSMNQGMHGAGLPALAEEDVLAIVGLSLPVAVARLLPGAPAPLLDRVVAGYREALIALRAAGHLPPLYPGALECLDALAAHDEVLLGIATGKPMRGLIAILEAHGLSKRFITRQSADGHPSKPHPAMLEAALSETGVPADRAVMIGDTTFDIQMARAAGMTGFGVSWGFHPVPALHAAGAALVATDYAVLTAALLDWIAQEQAA